MESQSGLFLHRVRLRTADREQALSYKLRLSQLLGAAELLPTAIPPSAVLVMRHLEDPLPGRLSLDHAAVSPPPAWQSAVRKAIQDMYFNAARPRHGRLSSTASAVLFASEAELLACLALAVLQGRFRQQWWWQAVLPTLGLHLAGTSRGPVSESLAAGQSADIAGMILSNPARIPAVLSYLEDWQEAVPVVSALAPAEARQALQAVLQEYGLNGLLSFPGTPSPQAAARPANDSPPEYQSHAPLYEQPVLPPWFQNREAMNSSKGLGREHAALLGIGLTLAKRPASAFHSSFQEAFQRWWRSAGLSKPSAPLAGGEYQSNRAAVPAVSRSAQLSSPSPVDESSVPVEAEPVRSTVVQPAPSPGMMDTTALYEWSAGTETSMGGVFFLLNLMRVMNISTVLETGPEPESIVGPWGVLELLARALLEESGEDLASDPLWRLLAELDGRPADTLPGAGLSPSGDGVMAAGEDRASLPLLQELATPLKEWLSLVIPGLRQRLLAALGMAEEEAAHLPRLVLALPARLYLTRSHLDVIFRMEDARIPVRMAGLDSNPGWLPRFGRVVAFHYV